MEVEEAKLQIMQAAVGMDVRRVLARKRFFGALNLQRGGHSDDHYIADDPCSIGCTRMEIDPLTESIRWTAYGKSTHGIMHTVMSLSGWSKLLVERIITTCLIPQTYKQRHQSTGPHSVNEPLVLQLALRRGTPKAHKRKVLV